MFNPNFNEKEKDFRKDLEGMGWLGRDIDAFMFRVHNLIATETQNFPDAFFTPSKLIKRIADRTNGSFKDYQQEIFEDPTPLFQECKIPLSQKKERIISPQSQSLVSPHLRLQAMRSRPRDMTKKFSSHTTQGLSVSAGEKGLLTVGKRTTLANAGLNDIEKEKTTKSAVKEPKSKKPRARSAHSRQKPVPPFDVLAAAGHRIVAETGKRPDAKSEKLHLPDSSPVWSTLFVQVLRGENTLTKIMDRYPAEIAPQQAEIISPEETIIHHPVEQTIAAPVIEPTGEQTVCARVEDALVPTVTVNGTTMNARDVFNGLMMLARKKILPAVDSPFHYIEGKSMRELDKHFRQNQVSGLEPFVVTEPAQVKNLKDFMVATGIARKEGRTLILAAPSHLEKLAKTLG